MIRPANPRARRRLFAANELTDEAKIDNVANIIQESITRDRIEKSRKWNFDFEKEQPLEGVYEWFKKDDTEWIGMKAEEKEISMKDANEVTPKSSDGDSVLVLKKRRRNTENIPDRAVKRRLSFH